MKKLISVSISTSLIVAGLLVIVNQGSDKCTPMIDETGSTRNESARYSNFVEFNQEMLELEKEVVQFQIMFHHDDVINVSLNMFVYYVDETITSGYFLLTDGEKPLLEPRCIWYVPERKYQIITPKIRLSVGKFWLVKILNDKEGKIRVGSASNDSGRFDVQDGDTWYLTLAVPTSSKKSGFSVVFESLYDSMEVTQLERNGNVGLYSASYNQFEGKYYAIKLSWFGGFSACNVFKEIMVKNGSIIDASVGGHRKGNIVVYQPNGEEKTLNHKGFMHYVFLGNVTGSWKFTVNGWSIYFRMGIVLLYIDINPHVKKV